MMPNDRPNETHLVTVSSGVGSLSVVCTGKCIGVGVRPPGSKAAAAAATWNMTITDGNDIGFYVFVEQTGIILDIDQTKMWGNYLIDFTDCVPDGVYKVTMCYEK